MNKKSVIVFIVLIVMAFIGLVAIQIYWINNSILLRGQEFDYNLNKALNQVVKKLEDKEVNQDEKERLVQVLDKTLHEAESVALSEKVLFDAKVRVNSSNEKYESVDSSFINNLEESQNTLLEQAGIIDDLLKGVYSLEEVYHKPITEKTNYSEIDSLLKEAINNRGINATYKFAVLNYNKDALIFDGKEELPKIISNGYRKLLYPNGIVEEPHYLWIYFPHIKRYLVKTMWVMLAMSILLLTMIIIAFWYSIKTIFRQKQLSLIKNDFINNMTHELKTPIATISLACEALNDPDMLTSEETMKSYVTMINDENKRLGLLVENVLRSSVLDQGEMELKLVKVNVHELLQQVIKNIAIQVRKKGGSIVLNLNALNPIVEGDKIHLTNMVYNLIDNALKYGKDNPKLVITTESHEKGIELRFKDNGIGIAKEHQEKIFDRLFRVPTGNVHNVKGFGLGLSYVHVIVRKHHGEIKVKSELGKGSEFIIDFPFKVNQ